MRELDLQRAFARARALAENFEYETGAVDYFRAESLFEVALLYRRKRAIHDDELDLIIAHERGDLLDLALAEIGGGADLRERDDLGIDGYDIDGLGETASFGNSRFRRADMAHPRVGAAGCALGK